jgi:hypothetical protein
VDALARLIEEKFDRWDRNHNGILELEEVERQVENHEVRKREAAVIVQLRRRLGGKQGPPRLSHDELLKLVEDRDFVKSVEATVKHLETIDRDLFLPADPDLSTFHQGRLGDCYFLSTVAADVHRRPNVLRRMIHPAANNGFEVHFGNGQKIKVSALTDCELLLGAKMDSKHGIWLAVLEKAFGKIRARGRVKKSKAGDTSAKPADIVPLENLGGGSCPPIISLLTGHQAANVVLRKTANSEQLHHLLSNLANNGRLMCVSEHIDSGKHPPGIVNHHCYGLLRYDVKRRKLTVFNPWGNTFVPKGPPGIANGYRTDNGVFIVPLNEFRQVFTALAYETDKPLHK